MKFRKMILVMGIITASMTAAAIPSTVDASATETISVADINTENDTTESTAEAEEASEWDDVVVVNVDDSTTLNVREKDGKEYKVIAKLNRGDKVEKVISGANWTMIRINGGVGFVSNEYVVSGEEAKAFVQRVEEEKAEKARKAEEAKKAAEAAAKSVSSDKLYSAKSFKSAGVVRYNGYRWTWYSQRVLPGGGLNIPGRHVDGNGYVCDGDGYICLASNDLKKGTVVSTPFGKKGKVYDCGCASGTLDVYVNW